MVNNFAPGIYSVLSRLHVYNIILHQVIYIALVSHVTLVSKKWIFNKKNLYHLHTKLSFVLTVIWGAVSFTKEKKKKKLLNYNRVSIYSLCNAAACSYDRN